MFRMKVVQTSALLCWCSTRICEQAAGTAKYSNTLLCASRSWSQNTKHWWIDGLTSPLSCFGSSRYTGQHACTPYPADPCIASFDYRLIKYWFISLLLHALTIKDPFQPGLRRQVLCQVHPQIISNFIPLKCFLIFVPNVNTEPPLVSVLYANAQWTTVAQYTMILYATSHCYSVLKQMYRHNWTHSILKLWCWLNSSLYPCFVMALHSLLLLKSATSGLKERKLMSFNSNKQTHSPDCEWDTLSPWTLIVGGWHI